MLSQHLRKRKRKVLSISSRTLRMMLSLSFVGGPNHPGRRIESFEVLPAIQRTPR